ncbi:MAG: hypothetical protein CME16_06765 [Gemmatimonadetes bacterium]|nr:hypothetical protein [Gemmatimonadota bacterium]
MIHFLFLLIPLFLLALGVFFACFVSIMILSFANGLIAIPGVFFLANWNSNINSIITKSYDV